MKRCRNQEKPRGLKGEALIKAQTLDPMSAASNFSTGQGLSSYSSTKEERLSPLALVFKNPRGSLGLEFYVFIGKGLCWNFLPPPLWQFSRSQEGSFWVDPTMPIYSGNIGRTQRLRRSEEEGKVRNASQVCGFGNLWWQLFRPRIRAQRASRPESSE